MKRKNNRLFYNTVMGIGNQLVVLICNFILPRQILLCYGSDTNGLVTSITQFLGFITLMDMGVGAVVQSALYKPLAEKNDAQISRILKSAKNFFNKIGKVLIVYVVALCILYPRINSAKFGFEYIVPLVLSISISSIAQYFFGIVNQLLLNADQRSYVQLVLNSVSLIINTIISVLLMRNGFSIQIVKIVAAGVLLIKPIGMALYVKRKYNIDKNIVVAEEPINQKWNGIAQHIAAYILSNTDVVVLTFFSDMKNVSIYNVYYLVVAGIRQCLTTMMTGVDALFGRLYATQDRMLSSKFAHYEWFMHTSVSMIYTVTAVLICPFISVYIKGVSDTSYNYPLFGILLVAAFGCYCLRLPYNTMVLAAGHYKETQNSAIIEALINIVISIAFVRRFGLYGVAIGTLIAMIYRTVYLAWYLQKAILYRPFCNFLKHIIVDVCIILTIFLSTKCLVVEVYTYVSWLLLALKVTFIACIETVALNMIFYKTEISVVLKVVKGKLFREN